MIDRLWEQRLTAGDRQLLVELKDQVDEGQSLRPTQERDLQALANEYSVAA